MISAISNNNMLPKMTSINHTTPTRTSTSEEAKESMGERMAEAQHSSTRATKAQGPTNLGNMIDRRI